MKEGEKRATHLVAWPFTSEECEKLLAMCDRPEFFCSLEEIRRGWAFYSNNTATLTLGNAERNNLDANAAPWALAQKTQIKVTTEPDVRKTMKRLAEKTNGLNTILDDLNFIEKSVLHEKGIEPLIEQAGQLPGLDLGLLVRVRDLVGYLEQAASLACEAENYNGLVFPRDHKKQNFISVLENIAETFEGFGLSVTDYRAGEAADGGPFWKAATIVLASDPSGEVWSEFFSRRKARKK